MAARFILPKRFPITPAFAGKRMPAFSRFNSSSSTSRAARVMEMAGAVEKPSALESAVPVMWALSGAAIFVAWNRMDEKKEDAVEKLLIV